MSRSSMPEPDRLREAFKRLVDTGVLNPLRLAGGLATLPWVFGRGASLGSLSQIHATSRPGRRAIVDRHGTLTWFELEQRVNQLVHALQGLGVEGDDEVAFVLRNGREFCECVLAAQKLGAVPAPLNTWGKARELGAILERERPKALVYDTRHADQLDGAVPDDIALVHVGDAQDALDRSSGYEKLLAGESALPLAPIARDRADARIVIHTSGTTGTPKAAARGTGASGGLALLGALELVPYRHDDVMYMPNPLFHSLGVLTFAIALTTGATMVLPDRFDPRQALVHLERHRVTAASFVPVMLRRMLDLDGPPDSDLSFLRIILVSGSAVPPELRERIRDRFGDVLHDLYGSTEAGWVAIATPQTMREAPDAVGRPVLGVEVAILDEDGEPVDGEGIIHVRSGSTFEGYESGEETDERAGYLSTGDLGYVDEHGYLHVVGRADDMVVVGGENVYPDEIEELVEQLDGVTEAAVLGVEDEEMGQVLTAFVVGSVTDEDVRDRCEEHLPSYKVPRRIEIVDELPRTATGKVLKNELAQRAGSGA